MKKRYHCSRHREATPSAIVYGDGFFCFGCGARGPVTELGLHPDERVEVQYVEDLPASIERIVALPKRPVRGFELHCNERDYYLVWPDYSYYKRRSFIDASPGGKYRGPSGHAKPWFPARVGVSPTLALVEGEFNALSLALVTHSSDIVSPGGAGDFYSKLGKQALTQCLHYTQINVIVDEDAAGAKAAIEATSHLLHLGHNNVKIHLVKKDFNDLLVQEGSAALRDAAHGMGLS